MTEQNQEPKNVIEALARIAGELPAIGKDGKAAPAQGGYSYRGIEAITAQLQGLMAKYGVVFQPAVVSWERDQITVASKPWTDDRLLVNYIISHGPSDTSTTICVPGVGRDNSDKGTNKAMTQALKYAFLQVFCIGDQKADADGESHEAEADPAAPFLEAIDRLGLDRQAIGDAVFIATADRTRNPREASPMERAKALDLLPSFEKAERPDPIETEKVAK